MSTMLLIALVSAGLFILVTVAFTLQTIEKNNRERRQMLAALKAQARNFEYMLEGFPQGFLNRDLRLLVCKCLSDAYERICKLDRKERASLAGPLEQVRSQSQTLAAQAGNLPYQPITDVKRIKEVQKLLNGLHTVVTKLQTSGRITAQQGESYTRQIRRLLSRTSVDAYREAANQALQSEKLRLAIHYLKLAIDRMSKDNADGFFSEQIEQLRAHSKLLEEQDASHGNVDQGPVGDEWDELDKPDDAWKKKAIYD